MNNFGIKELYDVALKTTYPIEMEGRVIEPGETIAVFDKISLANFEEISRTTVARGGYDARALVYWDETKEVRVRFSQGVFSKPLFALMSNAHLINQDTSKPVQINRRENVETDEEGYASTKFPMASRPFVYNAKTGEKITNFTWNEHRVDVLIPYLDIIIDYWFNYQEKTSLLTVGRPLTNGYLSLSGKTRVKDEITGQVKTGIINIPQLKLMSDLSMRLGKDASPLVGTFEGVAVPVGNRGNKKVMEILFLEEDIDSDM